MGRRRYKRSHPNDEQNQISLSKLSNADQVQNLGNEETDLCCAISEDGLREQYADIVDRMFDKCFSLTYCSDLPSSSFELCQERLLSIEQYLNSVKKKIPSEQLLEWRRHTAATHPLRSLKWILFETGAMQEPLSLKVLRTQAFCKFFEILKRFPQICVSKSSASAERNTFRTFHLCEAPGSFIFALKVFLQIYFPNLYEGWAWNANSLNPYFEWTPPYDMFFNDELIIRTYSQWIFGPDSSGDIIKWSDNYLDDLVKEYGKYDLITADGSIYCQADPSNQERDVLPLLNAEVKVSLALLRDGGSLILKMYTVFLPGTRELLQRLASSFESLRMCKPSCSKPSNSEVYLVCEGFAQVQHHSALQLLKLIDCAEFFCKFQASAINFNVGSFAVKRKDKRFMCFVEKKRKEAVRSYQIRMCTDVFSIVDFSLFEWPKAKLELFDDECNPWNFVKEQTQLEALKKVSYEDAIREITEIADSVGASILANTDECAFTVDGCLDCSCCSWLNSLVNMTDCEFDRSWYAVGGPDGRLSIRHSIFADLRTLTVLNAAELMVSDLCEPQGDINDCLFHTWWIARVDGKELSLMPLQSQLNWIEMLLSLYDDKLDEIEIFTKSQTPQILTRFSASVITFLSKFFEVVKFADGKSDGCKARTKISCRSFRKNYTNSTAIRSYLEFLKEIVSDGSVRLLHFVPVTQFRCSEIFKPISAFNNISFLRMIVADVLNGRFRST